MSTEDGRIHNHPQQHNNPVTRADDRRISVCPEKLDLLAKVLQNIATKAEVKEFKDTKFTNKELFVIRENPIFKEWVEALEMKQALGIEEVPRARWFAISRIEQRLGWITRDGKVKEKEPETRGWTVNIDKSKAIPLEADSGE